MKLTDPTYTSSHHVNIPDGRTISMTYDADGNLASVAPPGRQPYGFLYNLVDLVTGFVEPSVGSSPTATQYSYNLDRQLASETRPDGSQLLYNYDQTTP